MATMAAMATVVAPSIEVGEPSRPSKPALTPPTSEEWNQKLDDSSDLSDVEEDDEDIGEIEPDHYYDGGKIPVFKPNMDQFRSFKKFINKIDKYGMKSGIVKVVPPKEWRDSLQALDDAVKTIKVKNPITQEFSGTHGTYTQANIEKQRTYNLPQWKALTEESQHQPPAKRGERRRNIEKTAKPSNPRPRRAPKPADPNNIPEKRRPGRPRKHTSKTAAEDETKAEIQEDEAKEETELQVPPTPTSPETQLNESQSEDVTPTKPGPSTKARKPTAPRAKGCQPKSISERRKYNQRETADYIDEAAFENFDYRFHGNDEFSKERCAELENLYWKGLTFAPPMYGADMPGSLFDEATTSWNVAKLENLLDVLGQKVPGVNTAYLYLGMWKATFAWHLEDVDLYSINYIHFGAPKQWYSISQEDARRFENAMRNVWPNDFKNCSQFLRHKTYLISPALLQSQYNIKVNKLVHNEGEFVITFPYGYHSGYNLGYNCAESVNFATESWLEFGRIAKKCECEADSVWIDVQDIERKLRGEPTPEYYEETDDDESDAGDSQLPSPPPSLTGRTKQGGRKRKLQSSAAPNKVKKIKIRIKTNGVEPCILCPNDIAGEPLLATDTGLKAHEVCALYTPETYLEADENGVDMVKNVVNINKARLDLKCFFCRSKRGACFQCSAKKCTRAFHATCAMAAGVQVDFGPTPEYDEDGTEYYRDVYDFRCRYHRVKRPKNIDIESLESNRQLREYGASLLPNDIVQAQFWHSDIFAGIVIENRPSERTALIQILPQGDEVEVEWKWLLKLDPSDSLIVKPSPGAKPLPEHMLRQAIPERNPEFGPPKADDPFCSPEAIHKWAEFNTAPATANPLARVDLSQANKLWFYLPHISTETKPKFTEDPSKQVENPAGNFLESVKPRPLPKPVVAPIAISRPNQTPFSNSQSQYNPASSQWKQQVQNRSERPYQYKPKQIPHSKYQTSPLSQISPVQSNFTQPSSQSSRPPPLPSRLPYDYIPGRAPTSGPAHSPSQSRPGTAPMATMSGAPTAPMVGAPTAPMSASSPVYAHNPSSFLSSEYLEQISRYPYLKNAILRRPPAYKSPYPASGGFLPEYFPSSMILAPVYHPPPQFCPPEPVSTLVSYGSSEHFYRNDFEYEPSPNGYHHQTPPLPVYMPSIQRQAHSPHRLDAVGYDQYPAQTTNYASQASGMNFSSPMHNESQYGRPSFAPV